MSPALLVFLSGAAGLAHQILWTRRLVDVLGASAGTFAKVVGLFFLGLSLGGWITSRMRMSPARAWRSVAVAESLVALLALPAVLSSGLGGWLSRSGYLGPATEWILPALLLLPPAIAMGCVMPWVVAAIGTEDSEVSSRAVRLYGVNTLGGVAGILWAVFLGVEVLGLTGAGLATVGLNLGVAALALRLDLRRARGGQTAGSRSDLAEPSIPLLAMPGLIAFASGFLVMAQEVMLQHQFAQISISSFFSSASVLVFVLVGLAGGALLLPVWIRRLGPGPGPLANALLVAGIATMIEPILFVLVRPNLAILPYEWPPLLYFPALAAVGAVTAVPLMIAGGLVFPLVLREALVMGRGAGLRDTGRLLAVNGLGGWIGAELSEVALAPGLGIWRSVALLGMIYMLLGLIYQGSRQGGEGRSWRWLRATGVVLLFSILFQAFGSMPQLTPVDGERLLEVGVGREGVVAAVDGGAGDRRIVFNNSYTLGGSKAQFNQERQAHLPLLLHGHPRSVALLGVATGSTTAGAMLHRDVERIDAVELSPLVLKFAREHFAPYNRDVFADPRVHAVVQDARWVMAGSNADYDVVIGDLFLPWRTGEGRLFTQEHFSAVRRALKPGGVFCQWLPLFQLTRPQFETIARTFQSVFPDVLLVRGDFYTELPIVGLVGGIKAESIDWAGVDAGCRRLAGGSLIRDSLVRHVEGVAMCVVGNLPPREAGPVNTLGNAWLEWDAGRNVVGLRAPWFMGVPCAEMIREVHRSAQPLIPEPLRAAHDSGQFFLTLEIAAKLQLPQLANFKAQLLERIPEPLRNDPAADWKQWPSRVKPTIGL